VKCPACSFNNDYDVKTCQCGYAFEGPQTDSTVCLASIERSVRTIKILVVWWFILTLAGALLWLIVALAHA
jgi:hypothetical protein